MALVGCTASGKSRLALELARALGDVEIVTVDSMQVYRGMDIGTAKPTAAEQLQVPHHLIDLADPDEEWSLQRWTAAARHAVAGIESRRHRALLVGGTGLYFQALVDGLEPPGRYPALKRQLEMEEDTASLYARLTELDPIAAARMEPSNRRRVIRALEVTVGSGRPFSSYGPGMTTFPRSVWDIAGVWLPRLVVSARIGVRLREMVGAGLVAEVEELLARPGRDVPHRPPGPRLSRGPRASGAGHPARRGRGRSRAANPGLRPAPANVVAARPEDPLVRSRR